MSPFELLDHMLEKIHEYPHKARHYNRVLLKSIRIYKRKYRRSIRNRFKGVEETELSTHKKQKYERKNMKTLDLKIEATKNMLELTNSILEELEGLLKENDLGICTDLPSLHNTPNVIRVGGPSKGVYCECKQIAHGDMICCDSLRCKIKWFHFRCVSLNSAPKGSWYCPVCRKDWRLCRLE